MKQRKFCKYGHDLDLVGIYRYSCRKCNTLRAQQWRKMHHKEARIIGKNYDDKHKSDRREYAAQYILKTKLQAIEGYGGQCNCCGEKEVNFLTVDHVYNNGSLDITRRGRKIQGTSLCLKVIRLKFPKEYQILCMNCNFGKFLNKGICPHKQKEINHASIM